MSKLYRVALYDTEDGGHLLKEGLFTNAKLAKENFEAIKESLPDKELPPDEDELIWKNYNGRHFTEYHPQDYDLYLDVICADQPMTKKEAPAKRPRPWMTRESLIRFMSSCAANEFYKYSLKDFYNQTKRRCEDSLLKTEYSNKSMTYTIRPDEGDIITVKVTAKPYPYYGLDIEFS